MTRIWQLALTGTAVLVLSGCVNTIRDHNEPLNPGFGNAVSHNAAVAIIDPTPANASAGAPDLDGKRAEKAMTAYESGAAEQVQAETTTSDVTQ